MQCALVKSFSAATGNESGANPSGGTVERTVVGVRADAWIAFCGIINHKQNSKPNFT